MTTVCVMARKLGGSLTVARIALVSSRACEKLKGVVRPNCEFYPDTSPWEVKGNDTMRGVVVN